MTKTDESGRTSGVEQGTPCFVRHPDAGEAGSCEREATMRVYGLHFCEAHGEEAWIGALIEEAHDAADFFERFRNPHVPELGGMIDPELEAAFLRIRDAMPAGNEHYRALARAYPVERAPEGVRKQVEQWGKIRRASYRMSRICCWTRSTRFTSS